MSVSSIARSVPKPMLTVDRVRELLDAGGYRSSIIVAHRQQELLVGCSVALEFGDRIARDADGTLRMPIQCSVVLNGRAGLLAGITRWRIGKDLAVTVGQHRLVLALDADLLLGDSIGLDGVPVCGQEVRRHLLQLLADARATLRSLPVDDRRSRDFSPRLRIDARFAADLSVGRCGLVRQRSTAEERPAVEPPRVTRQEQKEAGLAACDGLADGVLRDFARAVHVTIGSQDDRTENNNGERSYVGSHH